MEVRSHRILRFETESLSEYQKNEILESAIGYYRGDLDYYRYRGRIYL